MMTIQSGSGMRRLVRHWIPHWKGTLMLFHVSQSRKTGNTLYPVHMTRQFWYGMRILARYWVPYSEDTLIWFCLLQSCRGHTDSVSSVSISPDGKCIVSGSDDLTIRLWDAETGEALGAPLRGHTDSITSVSVSPDGNCMLSGSCDLTIRIWDVKTGEALGAPLRGHTGSIVSIAISPNGRYIISGSIDKTIRVWSLEFPVNENQPLKAPAIRFSSNPTHSLCSATTSFLQYSRTPGCHAPNEEGWVIGPEKQLLLHIPTHFHPVTYASNVLVIPNSALQLDLSCFAHGTSWHMCRELATLS